MKFGLQFFPSVSPAEKSAEAYWQDALRLVDRCDELGFEHVRTVEHYFEPYGGYSPNPLIFLAAAAQRTRKARLVTGAVLPAFNNPLKLAGELAMMDAISSGRLDIGFARAFLPHEFERFGIPLDESRDRFNEGVEQIMLLLGQENVSYHGRFHSFDNLTSLPRPTQLPMPPIWVAAIATPQSFVDAGTKGFNLMTIPIDASKMAELYGLYREAWRKAGHSGQGTIMTSFFMNCASTTEEAIRTAKGPVERHLRGLVDSAAAWMSGASTKDYPGYDTMIAQLKTETFELQREKMFAWVGTPREIIEMIQTYDRSVGGIDIASLLVLPNDTPVEVAERSMATFSEYVMPRIAVADSNSTVTEWKR